MADKCKAGRLLRHEVKPREETLWLARKEEVKEEEQIRGGEGKGGEGHPNINRCSRERKKKRGGAGAPDFPLQVGHADAKQDHPSPRPTHTPAR